MSDPDKTFWEGCHIVGGCNAWHRENDKLCASEAAIAELLAALKDARDMVEEWGAYAGDYFREKWNFHGDLAKLDAAIAKAERPRIETE